VPAAAAIPAAGGAEELPPPHSIGSVPAVSWRIPLAAQAQLPEADCSAVAATVSGYKALCIYVKCGYYFLAHIATSFVDFLSNLQQISLRLFPSISS
jgi:hypothetical protein